MDFAHHKSDEREGQNRLLLISALDVWSMGRGKGAQSLWKTLEGYAESGWEVHFVTGNRGDSSGPALHPNIRIYRFDVQWLKRLMGVRIIATPAKVLWWLWFQAAAGAISFRIRRRVRIDVVYAYEICGVLIARILSRLWRTPVVSRFQGTILAEALKRSRMPLRHWDHMLAMKIKTDLIIMTNDGTQGDRVLERLGANMDRVRFWMNGVDWEAFTSLPERTQARRRLGIESGKMILMVSRLVSWKRVERAISRFPEVVRTFPDCLLVVVGTGPDRERLEQLSASLKMGSHIRFEGGVPHSDISEYLTAADLFLSLYDWSNVGNPLLEAMMAGKCIVTLNNGDTGRFIRNGVNGVLLEPEDLSSLPQILTELLRDEERRARLGAEARRSAEERFWSWDERMDAEVAEVGRLMEQCEMGQDVAG